MEQSGLEVSKQNLRKFRRNGRKFRSAEVPHNSTKVSHFPGKLLKIKIKTKIKLFEILLLYSFKELMMMKIKTLEFNHMKKEDEANSMMTTIFTPKSEPKHST